MIEVVFSLLLNNLLPIFIVVFTCECLKKLTRMETIVETENEVQKSGTFPENTVKKVTLEDWCLLRLEGTVEDTAESADEDHSECLTWNEDSPQSVTLNEDAAESVTSNEDSVVSVTDSVVSIILNKDPAESLTLGEDPTECVTLNEVHTESITLNEDLTESLTLNEGCPESLTLNEDPIESVNIRETELNEGASSPVARDIIQTADLLTNTEMSKVYDVNGSSFVENESLSSHNDDTIVRYELYKVDDMTNDDEGSEDEDIISELEIQTQALHQGLIINSNVFLTDAQWHTMSLVGGDLFRCAVCQLYCDRANCEDHTKLPGHVWNLKNYRPLKRFDLSIVRKINTSFHCGVCNEIFDIIDYRTHENSKSHEGNLLTAINKVSDLMYDSNIHKKAYNDDQSSENGYRHQLAVDRNGNRTDRSIYGTDRNINSPDRNVYSADRNVYSPDRNIWSAGRDYANNYDNISVYECSDDDEEYTYEGEEYSTPSQGISYASMASKPTINLPKLMKIDLGNKEVRVRFESWHMIGKLGLNKYYCMVCNKIDLIRYKSQHCMSCDHLERLARCTVVEAFEDYLIRQVGDKLYHCGHCNNLQHQDQMTEHIDTTHPKKNKNIVESVNSPIKTKKVKCNTDRYIPNRNVQESNKFKTEREKSAILKESVEYRIEKKIDPNFDIFGDITLSPFGSELRISALAFNIIMERGDEYYCVICDKICADVRAHVEDLDHVEVMNMTPFIRPFKSNLTRAVRGTLHCSLCNKLVPVNDIGGHNIDQPHTTALAVALGMKKSQKPDNTNKNNYSSDLDKPGNINKTSNPNKNIEQNKDGLNKCMPGTHLQLPFPMAPSAAKIYPASPNQGKKGDQNFPHLNRSQNESASFLAGVNNLSNSGQAGENAPQNVSFPGQNTSFPGQNSTSPGQKASFPGQKTSFPGENASSPGQKTSFPGENASSPGQKASFPGQKASFPGQNISFTGQNTSFPGQNASFPGQNTAFPGQNTSFLEQSLLFAGLNMNENEIYPLFTPLPLPPLLNSQNSQYVGAPLSYTNFSTTAVPYFPNFTTQNVPNKETKAQNSLKTEAQKKRNTAKLPEKNKEETVTESTVGVKNNVNKIDDIENDNFTQTWDNIETDNLMKTSDNIETDNITKTSNNIETGNIIKALDNIKTGNIMKTSDNNEMDKTDAVNTSIEEELDIDEDELIYVKFKNMHSAYFKINYLSYNTLVYMDKGMKHCFVCSNTVPTSALQKHLNSRGHTDNVSKNKFLDKYGVQLFRQMYLMYHCAICNVLMTRKEIKMHLDWPEHIACYDAAHETRSKKNRRGHKPGIKEYVVKTQKEAIFHNVNEPKFNVIAAYHFVPNLEAKKETTEAKRSDSSKSTVVKKKKMVIFNNVVMKIGFDQWHGIVCSKNVTKCIICQMQIKQKEIMVHVETDYHNVALGKTFEKTYYPALVRKITENSVNCMFCNLELPNNEYMIHEHVNGRKHHKNQDSIVNESSNSDSYTDCYEEYLNL